MLPALTIIAAIGVVGLSTANTAVAMEKGSPSPAASVEAMAVVPFGPTVRLSPDSGPPGTVVDVDGVGWPQGVFAVEAHWGIGGKPLQPIDLEIDQGVLEGTATIPEGATPGRGEAVEVCAEYGDGVDTSTRCAWATFSVVREPPDEPDLVADPRQGQRGSVVELSGRWADRAAGEDVSATVVWQPTGENLGPATIAPDGTITGNVTIPSSAAVGAGTLAVCFDETRSGRQCIVTDFEVVGPTLERDPAEVEPGNIVRLTGTGWCCANDHVTVDDVANERWGTGIVDDAGNLTAEVEVPLDALAGTVELEVCSAAECDSTEVVVLGVDIPDTTTTTEPPTTDPPTTPPPDTTAPPTTPPLTTDVPPATDVPSTDVPTTEGGSADDDDLQAVVAGLIAGGGAALVAGALVARRFSGRRRAPRMAARVVPRPDAGHQSVRGHGGPAITVSAVLDIGQQRPTMHFRRKP